MAAPMALNLAEGSGIVPILGGGLRVQHGVTLGVAQKGKNLGRAGGLQELRLEAAAIKEFGHGGQNLQMGLALLWWGQNQEENIDQLAVDRLAVDASQTSRQKKTGLG